MSSTKHIEGLRPLVTLVLHALAVLSGVVALFHFVNAAIMATQFQGWPSRDNKVIALVSDSALEAIRISYLRSIFLSVVLAIATVFLYWYGRPQNVANTERPK